MFPASVFTLTEAPLAMRNPKEVVEIHGVGADTVSYQSNLKSKKRAAMGFCKPSKTLSKRWTPVMLLRNCSITQQR